ncbi:anaerobic ribonucleoside-triphosphate reductase activating protein [Corynebacterium xerosis]|uniref:Anaerobic ribonucleoside-triphosphate reductase activating protein n=1 Tax=Corynebacterium xerosis TaxID=1725 RepID=A0A7X9XTM0_9CORY|nr:anaerobic ribonucleoside-triphosphate reductase activating protein [Corynebacterium xerosis]NMF09769.1 anaerobic ribonucleoside-triphosphate reductase activating protein [Corynebacterium xerosis]
MLLDSLYDVPAPPPSPGPAVAPVPVAGVVPFSSVDWPGRLAATVFLQGCPWRCPYCHNPGLQATAPCEGGVGDGAGEVSWAGFVDLLGRRRGLLDGVVFTGGEPTMHRGLGAAIDEVHVLGFDVGLHTSGCYPEALGRILDDHRPEWIGLDVKADPRDAEAYAEVAYGGADFVSSGHGTDHFTGAQLATGGKELRSLRMIRESMPGRLEVRTTVWPDSPAVAGLPGIAEMLAEISGVAPLTWAIQKARPDGVSPDAAAAASFRADRPGWATEFDGLVADARATLRDSAVTVVGR